MIIQSGWFRRHRWVIAVLAVAVAGMFATYLSTHQIFPDTQYYLAWTYRLMGYPDAESERIVLDYIRTDGVFKPYDHLWGSPLELATKPRLLVPLLSIPLVKVFGPGAIVVIPGLAFLLSIYVIYRFAALHAGEVAAAAVTCAIAVSHPVLVWSVGGLTDSAALLFHALMLYLLPWRQPATWKTATAVGAMCALASTARMISPFTVAAVALLWFWAWLRREDRRSWTIAAGGAALGTVAGTVWTKVATTGITTTMYYYLMSGGQIRRLRDIPAWYLEKGPGYIWDEALAVMSSPTLILLITMSAVACWTARRTVMPWLVCSAWLGAAGLFLINPSPTGFRYELPMLPALAAAAAVALTQLIGRPGQRVLINRPRVASQQESETLEPVT